MVVVGAGMAGSAGFDLPTGGGNTWFANNCLDSVGHFGGNLDEAGTVWSGPGFVNGGAGNFAARAGSPCAGKGATITSIGYLLSLP